jgi:hypothetical protein
VEWRGILWAVEPESTASQYRENDNLPPSNLSVPHLGGDDCFASSDARRQAQTVLDAGTRICHGLLFSCIYSPWARSTQPVSDHDVYRAV